LWLKRPTGGGGIREIATNTKNSLCRGGPPAKEIKRDGGAPNGSPKLRRPAKGRWGKKPKPSPKKGDRKS